MAGRVYIARGHPDGSGGSPEGGPITFEEWLDCVSGDPELRLLQGDEGATAEGPCRVAAWVGRARLDPCGRPDYFTFERGRVDAEGPDPVALWKMSDMARSLGARVRGENGETLEVLEQAAAEPPASAANPAGFGCGCIAALMVWFATGVLSEPLGCITGLFTGAIAFALTRQTVSGMVVTEQKPRRRRKKPVMAPAELLAASPPAGLGIELEAGQRRPAASDQPAPRERALDPAGPAGDGPEKA